MLELILPLIGSGCLKLSVAERGVAVVNALKYLPWKSLTLAAFLSVVVVKAADLWVGRLLGQLDSTSVLMKFLLTRTGFTVLFFCAGLAVGSLGVLFLEKFEAHRAIYSSSLWALVLCLLISLWLIVQLNIEGLSLGAVHYTHTIGIVVGVFWKGRHYRR
jgi:hypothetical protein